MRRVIADCINYHLSFNKDNLTPVNCGVSSLLVGVCYEEELLYAGRGKSPEHWRHGLQQASHLFLRHLNTGTQLVSDVITIVY